MQFFLGFPKILAIWRDTVSIMLAIALCSSSLSAGVQPMSEIDSWLVGLTPANEARAATRLERVFSRAADHMIEMEFPEIRYSAPRTGAASLLYSLMNERGSEVSFTSKDLRALWSKLSRRSESYFTRTLSRVLERDLVTRSRLLMTPEDGAQWLSDAMGDEMFGTLAFSVDDNKLWRREVEYWEVVGGDPIRFPYTVESLENEATTSSHFVNVVKIDGQVRIYDLNAGAMDVDAASFLANGVPGNLKYRPKVGYRMALIQVARKGRQYRMEASPMVLTRGDRQIFFGIVPKEGAMIDGAEFSAKLDNAGPAPLQCQ